MLAWVWIGAWAIVGGCGDDAAGGAQTSTGSSTGTTQAVSTTNGPTDPTPGMTSLADTTSAIPETSTSTGPTASSGTTSTSSTGDGGSTTGIVDIPPFDPMCDGMGSGSGSTGGSGGSTGGTGGTTGGGSDTGGGSSTGGGVVPNGGACSLDGECASNECYVIPLLGGICGECTEDADCSEGGCTPPNPLTQAPSVCNQGEQGGGCETDAACCGIGLCNVVVSAPGIFDVATCGQCATDADCGGPGVCQPDLDVGSLTGLWECVAPGSLPDGSSCSPDAAGDGACTSGVCAAADVMGLLTVGICSECESNADCPGGTTCMAAEVDLAAGLIPGMCV